TILHWIAIGEDAVLRLDPLDDIDEMFRQEIAQAHTETLHDAGGAEYVGPTEFRMLRCDCPHVNDMFGRIYCKLRSVLADCAAKKRSREQASEEVVRNCGRSLKSIRGQDALGTTGGT